MRPLFSPKLAEADRRALLALARQAVVETVSCLRLADLPPTAGRLAKPGGAFVTLRCSGKLRGCIGRTDGALTLAENVVQCAITAALHDSRFRPLRREEIAGLEIEISVVSEPQSVRIEEIELGIHGVLVCRDASRGLLLPQVAHEHNWSAAEFLEAACRKAGLEAGAWRDPETKLFAFTAEVFSETDPGPSQEQPAGS
jgi:AmmeMemoRadiSam system protein A